MHSRKSYCYIVYGTPKGKVKRTMCWQVHSYMTILDFIENFQYIAPEYDIDVYYDPFYEMQILSAREIKE